MTDNAHSQMEKPLTEEHEMGFHSNYDLSLHKISYSQLQQFISHCPQYRLCATTVMFYILQNKFSRLY
jgi:hypothetical protein